jgi:hypothetical protein
LTVLNYVCEISFIIEPSGGVGFGNPGKGADLPKLASGEPRFETRTTGLAVTTVFFDVRAGQINSDKYRQWSSALTNGARDWFEK